MAEKGFLQYERKDPGHRAVEERVHDFKEMEIPLILLEIE